MPSTIVTKNSSTASAVPVTGDLTQGELAVNVTDKKLYTKDSGGTVVKLVGGLGNQEANAVAITGGSINGTTVGATTASTGAFTTLSASSTVSGTGFSTYLASPPAIGGTAAAAGSFTTLSASSTTTLSGGTANGVAYLNGSKEVATGSALTFDGTTLGVGTSGSAWSTLKAVDLGSGGAVYGTAGQGGITANAYYGGSGFVYKATNGASVYQLVADSHRWSTAASGTGGTGITFTEGMRLNSTGLGIGTSSPSYKLDITSASDASLLQIKSTAIANNTAMRFGIDGNNSFINASGGSTGVLQLRVFGTTQATLDTSGNLGLGVTPSAWGSNKAFQVGNSGFPGCFADIGGDIFVGANAYNDGTWRYRGTYNASLLRQSVGTFAFFTAPSGTAGNAISFTQAMTLDASGNLMVGQTSATGKLSVTGTGSGNLGIFAINATDTSSSFVWAHQAFLAGQTSGQNFVNFIGKAGSTLNAAYVGYKFSSAGSTSNLLTFGHYGADNLMNLDGSGRLLVGKTSTGDYVTGVELQPIGAVLSYRSSGVAGIFGRTDDGETVRFSNNSNTVGSISTTGSATAYNTSSDYRLKDNQQPLTGSGEFIDALQPKTWKWKADGSKGVGFIAHEVQAVSPGSVVGDKDAVDEDGNLIMQAMEYGSAEFIANIIAELQSLRARVAQLEGK